MHAIQPQAGLIDVTRGSDVDLSVNRDLSTMHVRQLDAAHAAPVRHTDALSALMSAWVQSARSLDSGDSI